MRAVSSKMVGVETFAGGKKIARPDPKAGRTDILLLPDLNQEVDVGQKKPRGILESDTKSSKVDKNPERCPKNVVGNVGKSGSVSSKGSVSNKSEEEEDLVDFKNKEEEEEEKQKEEIVKMEKDAQRIIDEEMQSDGSGKEEKSGGQK